jgi:hypothetical protein
MTISTAVVVISYFTFFLFCYYYSILCNLNIFPFLLLLFYIITFTIFISVILNHDYPGRAEKSVKTVLVLLLPYIAFMSLLTSCLPIPYILKPVIPYIYFNGLFPAHFQRLVLYILPTARSLYTFNGFSYILLQRVVLYTPNGLLPTHFQRVAPYTPRRLVSLYTLTTHFNMFVLPVYFQRVILLYTSLCIRSGDGYE